MIKKIILGLLALVVILVLLGFLMPGKIEVSRSIAINAPAEYSFEEVNNLQNWEKWSYWHSLDTTMQLEYSTPRLGAGAFYVWKSEAMGNGKATIIESIPNQSVKVDLDFMDQGTAQGWYTFEPEGEGTKVTMGFTTDFGMNPIGRLMGPFLKSEMNKAFDYGLEKLKALAESKPVFTVPITEENINPISYIGISHTMSPQDPAAIAREMGRMYGELLNVIQRSKTEMTGSPFCLYPSYSQESMNMVCALPVAADAKLPAKYPVKQTPGGTVVKAIHKGAYDKLEATHNELNRYIEYKGLEIAGAPWEVYVTDPGNEPDTAKWITEVIYPVKQRSE